MSEPTVVALSSPPGESAVAVVRMTGPEAESILAGMASESGPWKSHHITRTFIRDSSGELVDETLAVLMKGPNSYTGEDLVEIYCHGSMHIAEAVIEEAISRGAEMAPPGEFTKRAFLNGKLDISQAEAVADLISSETALQSRVALEHLRGALSGKVREIEKILLEQLARVEGSIDFCEEEGIGEFSAPELKNGIERAINQTEKLIDTGIPGNRLRKGLKVTLAGPRNAGKSSIYNALLGEERAIVSHIPGTTRDLLRERIHIRGFTYYLEDTAGIAETGCDIENKGISVGRKAARDADILLFVIDGSREISREDRDMAEGIKHDNYIILLNKRDLGLKVDAGRGMEELGTENILEVSAVSGYGLDTLRDWIYEKTATPTLSALSRQRIAVNGRQCAALMRAKKSLEEAAEEMDRSAPAEILAVWLREAVAACGEITGRSVEGDVLDEIFSRFCVGK